MSETELFVFLLKLFPTPPPNFSPPAYSCTYFSLHKPEMRAYIGFCWFPIIPHQYISIGQYTDILAFSKPPINILV